jgi:chromosome segregation protein
VQDLSAAVTALRTLRSENLGQADVLVYQPGHAPSNISIPSSLTPVSAHIRSGRIGDLLASLLNHIVVAENANDAADILRTHPSLTVVTKDGDIISASRARGGSKSSASLIEVKALIEDLEKKLEGDKELIQCRVGLNGLPCGSAQQPDILDYADGVDTMKWLLSL